MKLEAIGFWFNDRAPSGYPRPQLLVGTWPKRQRMHVLAHLRTGMVFEAYGSKSYCRFACGHRAMGSCDQSDGVFVWPEGLAHYVEAHSVTLPAHFVRHAVEHPDPPIVNWNRREGLIDDAPWLAWSRKQGATLDFTGWEHPDLELRQRLTAELKAAKRPRTAILLVHPVTREVVVRLHSGALVIVQLRAPYGMRRLAGWDEWPLKAK